MRGDGKMRRKEKGDWEGGVEGMGGREQEGEGEG